MQVAFDINAYECLPNHLAPSAYIDFLLLLARLKPALRIGPIKSKQIIIKLIDWSKNFKFNYCVGRCGFVYITYNYDAAEIQKIDDSSIPHELLLGLLLGYPQCCCDKISSVGELHIDSFEHEIETSWFFNDNNRIINPIGYKNGQALISHLPCSTTCIHSLAIAKKALNIVHMHQSHPIFLNLKNWLELQNSKHIY